MLIRPSWIVVGVGLFVLSPVACSSKKASSGFASSDASTGGDDGSAGDDSGLQTIGGDGGTNPGCATHCSADLHDVLDCNDNVVAQCPPDQGCGAGGQCVAACDAANANKSTIGCDYYSVDPGTDGEANGSCFAAYIANTWGSPVKITLEYNGTTTDAAPYAFIPTGQGQSITYASLASMGGMLPANQLAIVFLADATAVTHPSLPTACPPTTQAFYKTAEASSEVTAIVHAFHITTSAPVVAYDIFPYGGSRSYISSATLLIPSSAWDTNYVPIDAFAKSQIAGPTAQPFIEVAASQDATHVTVLPKVAIAGGTGVSPGAANTPVTYTLNHGEVLQLKQDTELNGSPIQSDKPVGVWGGNSCMNIDVTDAACDSGHQQLPPVKALGNEYVAAHYRDRVANTPENPPWRIMGVVDGTQLTYAPSAPAGAPTTLSTGQVAQFTSEAPFVVTSQDTQHPFYVSGHMGGQNYMGQDYGSGDPDFVNMIPPAQWLASYIFMTDPTMANTNLVLVRKKQADGSYKDVTLDCAGVVSGWLPIGTTPYQLARVDLTVNGANTGSCGNGRHSIKSDAAFGLTVWGWDQYVSYAYPSGASVQPINTVVVPPTPQ